MRFSICGRRNGGGIFEVIWPKKEKKKRKKGRRRYTEIIKSGVCTHYNRYVV